MGKNKLEKEYTNKEMIITTTDEIPGKKYKILGFVSSNRLMSIFSKTEAYKVESKLVEEARAMGADAVVCVRMGVSGTSSTTMYGTAVKFI